MQADGRVIDYSTPAQQTTSEGQSYGMFFALVANDRATFERLLNWTRANLAANQFDAQNVRLPAWQWGKKPDGSFGVLDPNSASDSDLWIAYDLLQAGRLWKEPAFTQLGTALAAQIVKQEVVDLPGLGPMLLPGPQGFKDGRCHAPESELSAAAGPARARARRTRRPVGESRRERLQAHQDDFAARLRARLGGVQGRPVRRRSEERRHRQL